LREGNDEWATNEYRVSWYYINIQVHAPTHCFPAKLTCQTCILWSHHTEHAGSWLYASLGDDGAMP